MVIWISGNHTEVKYFKEKKKREKEKKKAARAGGVAREARRNGINVRAV